MKIIIVCYPTFGGSGILATELGHKLSKNGHVVHFIAYEKPVRLEVNDENIFFHKVNVPFFLSDLYSQSIFYEKKNIS